MKVTGETYKPYKYFDIWMASNASLGEKGRGCIAIDGRCVKRFQSVMEWNQIVSKSKKVIDNFWEQDNAEKKYNSLKRTLLKKPKDYLNY